MKFDGGIGAGERVDIGSGLDAPAPESFETLRVPTLGPLPQTNFLEPFQRIIDTLPEQIGLLDESWNIVVVNLAWEKTADVHGYSELRPGANYFEYTCRLAEKGNPAAQSAMDDILQYMQGTKSSLYYIYPGHGQAEGRTFQLCIGRMEMGGRNYSIVTRYDVTELVQLRRAREAYSHSLLEGQAEERRRIAREIHDSASQSLVAIRLDIGQLKRTECSRRALDLVADMELLLGEAQREIRSLSFLAHPPMLQELGLADALKALVSGFERRAGINIRLQVSGDLSVCWRSAEVAIYRFVQEAISNVHRHAQATDVAVGVHLRRSMVHAVVADNGVGLPPGVQAGVGLSGMRARVAELGGKLRISQGSPGTVLIASLPIHPRLASTGDLASHRLP